MHSGAKQKPPHTPHRSTVLPLSNVLSQNKGQSRKPPQVWQRSHAKRSFGVSVSIHENWPQLEKAGEVRSRVSGRPVQSTCGSGRIWLVIHVHARRCVYVSYVVYVFEVLIYHALCSYARLDYTT